MREIKFRALAQGGKIVIYNVGCIEFFKDDTIIVNNEIPIRRLIEYTNYHDKKGKEIYEGDIIKIILEDYHHPISNLEGDDIYPPKVENICEIRYRNSCGFVALVRNKPYKGKILNLKDGCDEVMGNIYENPEFLTKQK